MQSILFLARIVLMLIGMKLLHAKENPCTPNLPPFVYQNPRTTPILPVGVQILLPAQTFACSGSVTMWGIAVNGSGSHDVHLQIWRPSSVEADNETRSYTLVGSNIFYVEPIPGISLFYLMPDERRTLSVERGDVLGLYIEARGTEDSFHVQYQKNVTDSMIYAYASDSALDFIEPDSMPASSVLLEAVPVMYVIVDPAVITESTTPTMEGTTPTDSSATTSESTTPTTEVIITMESPTPTITQTTTTQLLDDTTSPSSTPDTTQTMPTYTATTPTHRTATADPMSTPTVKGPIITTSEGESTDTKITTSEPAESDEEVTVTTEERTSVSPDETKPTLALPVVMMTSAMAVGIVGVCLVLTVMLVRGLRRRSHRGHGHCLPHKPASLPPPPMSPPPPPPPQYEVGGHSKEKNFQAKLASSLSSSLTSSLIWWLHGEKEQLRMLMAREYETPIVTKCHVTMLESSMHDYDTPVVASAQVVNFLQHSAHLYEDIS